MGINEYIARQFANLRGIGGRIVMAVMNRQNAEMYKATEALLHPKDTDTVLDIGCGNGVMLERLADVHDCRFIGTDISEDVLRSAKLRVRSKRVELLCCSVDDMPLEDSTVDAAFTINTLYFWDNLARGFEEVARVLKPEGTFIATHYTSSALDAYPHTQYGYSKHSENEVATAACNAGFSVELKPIMNDKAYCLVCRRK